MIEYDRFDKKTSIQQEQHTPNSYVRQTPDMDMSSAVKRVKSVDNAKVHKPKSQTRVS